MLCHQLTVLDVNDVAMPWRHFNDVANYRLIVDVINYMKLNKTLLQKLFLSHSECTAVCNDCSLFVFFSYINIIKAFVTYLFYYFKRSID